jgi:hypothetical protein
MNRDETSNKILSVYLDWPQRLCQLSFSMLLKPDWMYTPKPMAIIVPDMENGMLNGDIPRFGKRWWQM